MPGITASRNYFPGDLIYSEECFAKVLPRKLKDIACESCGKREIGLKYCKSCLSVKYCGKTCQRKDWKSHQFECKYLKNLPEDNNADFVRLLGKIIFKTKGKCWKDIKKRILGADFCFDDMDSYYKDMTENPRMNLRYKELRFLTRKYLGEENMPSDVDLIKIIGKMIYNSYMLHPESIAFYIGTSLFESECIPNTNIHQVGKDLKIRANQKINGMRERKDKISIPSRIRNARIRIFDDLQGSPCKCTDCSLPYGESVLTKIIDHERAYSIIKETENLLKLETVFSGLEIESSLIPAVDDLLRRQEGVLGNTNSLRLRLMAFRYVEIGDRAFELINPLLKLEKYTKSVFGEYSLEMEMIYELLVNTSLALGDFGKVFKYTEKLKRVEY